LSEATPLATPLSLRCIQTHGRRFLLAGPPFYWAFFVTGHFLGSFVAFHATSLMACAITLSLDQDRLAVSLRIPSTLTDRTTEFSRLTIVTSCSVPTLDQRSRFWDL
jgi:hypothetical protein